MDYRLVITERAEELLDNIVYYLQYRLKSEQAAKHLLSGIEKIYDRLEKNPYQFLECKDPYLKSREYREAVIPDMDYLLIFRIEKDIVYVLGIFHSLEKYKNKL